MSDTASESGSSCSSKLAEEASVQGPEASGGAATTPRGKEDVTADAPGKVVEETGAVGGASAGAGATAGATAGAAVSSIERLLQQQRNEIMFELRRLQMGDRPVTGQGHKEAVESFFTSQLHPDSEQAAEEHRPETVHVEVRALAESRPVSSLLHSTRFRRSLESALRTAIGTRSPRAQQSPQQTPTSSPSPRPAPRRSLARQGEQGRTPVPRVPSPLVRETPSPAENDASVPSPRGFVPIPPPPPAVEALIPSAQQTPAPAPQNAPQNAPREQAQPATREAYPEQWLLHNVPSVSEQRIIGGWQQLEEMQREDFISEISELVQRQLVTQTLGGSFRNTLENMMQERVAASGSRGEQTLQFIQSLQPSEPHRRNDFSDLGIATAPVDAAGTPSDPLDDVSVISATAAVTVQASQQQMLMSREMRALKAQMAEMQAMLKTAMTMQLETQRSIRQEVAAALAHQQAPATDVPAPGRHPVDDTKCLICVEMAADTVLYRCGHLCVCHGCGLELRQRGCHCPVCRAPINDIIRVYKSGQS